MASRKWWQKLGGTQWMCHRNAEAAGGRDLCPFSVGEDTEAETESSKVMAMLRLELAPHKPADEMAAR